MAMIQTTKGLLDESRLEKRTGKVDNEFEKSTWVEYWLEGELVHRSAETKLKPIDPSTADVGSFA
jgi:hypothetical protein